MHSEIHPYVLFMPSPHFSARGGMEIDGVVLHYTAGGSARGSIAWTQNPVSKVSWHFTVGRNGEVFQHVLMDHAAWHAGASEMSYRGEMKHNANRFTLGVELANHGFLLQDRKGQFWYELAGSMKPYRQRNVPSYARLSYDSGASVEGWWEPYTDTQIKALQWLLTKLSNTNATCANAVKNLVGHEEIAMPFGFRKRDPGPLFPWALFDRALPRRTTSEVIR